MTTAVQVQYRRGTSSQVAAFTGAQGEMVVDTSNNRLVMQDGVTAGGWPAAKLSEVVTNTRTAVADANYTAQTTDRSIAYTALSAARTVTLPAAAGFPTGTILWVVDESGNAGTDTITIAPNGSDRINGSSSSTSIATSHGSVGLESNGSNGWTKVGGGAGSGGSGTVTSVAAGAGLSGGTITTSGTLAADPAYWPSSIGGLTLSNDGTTPNSLLDIAAGAAADSTNAVLIKLGVFTKSTGGSWTAGSGNNGMGNGLTIAASTWYHVMLANNNGTPDIWFDTSATGANRPSGISDSKYRRIGSFKTDSSSHILAFSQYGNLFLWYNMPFDVNVSNLGTTPTTYTISTPPGVYVYAQILGYAKASGQAAVAIYSGGQNTSQALNIGDITAPTGGEGSAGFTQVVPSTSSQITAVSNTSSTTLYLVTKGWIDWRGQ